jgi:hypothetical protein
MARNARPTQAKRAREKDLLERRQMKEVRRRDVKERKAGEPPAPPGVDLDIADITPGPQPLADWQVELKEEEEAAAAAALEADESP